ncbi:MAG: DNA polymerase II large subunit [archaeon]
MQQYFTELERKVKVAYSIAEEARAKGLDPKSTVEISLATRLSEKVTGLVSIKYPQVKDEAIERRIVELEKEHGLLNPAVAIKIAEEISLEKFCKFKDKIEAMDAAIRIGIAYSTLGVVSSPLEGFTELKLKKTASGEDYFAIYFSGPIRSAGGTAAAFSVVIADYLRERFGYAKYDPTPEEVKRTITEIQDYHERVTNLQYLPSEKEVEILASNIPVQVTGEPSEEKEVSNYKDLQRIETNCIRSGICLVLAEGIAQKCAKLIKIVKGLNEKGLKLSSWDFLQDIAKLQKKVMADTKPSPSDKYIQDLVAGRPVLSHPSRAGGFRLRYGRTRTTGYSAAAIHPATMIAFDDFIALGSQFRMERPGKSAAIVSCDGIEGPIVKLSDGSLIKLKTTIQAEKIRKDIKEIVYVGDILISYGDFFNRNHVLMPCGYNEGYWAAELKSKTSISVDPYKVNLEKAIELSKEYAIPLHPQFIFYWSQITPLQFNLILEWILESRFEEKFILPHNEKFNNAKRALEILGVEHIAATEDFVVKEEESSAFLINLGIEPKEYSIEKIKEVIEIIKNNPDKNLLEIVNTISKFKIRDRAGSFIGARMGRPEKAKMRKLTGNPHVLFPVGEAGGRMRSVQEACETNVKAEFPIYFCDKCNLETIYFVCENCNSKTRKMYYCKDCDRKLNSESCHIHGKAQDFMTKRIDLNHYLDAASRQLNLQKIEVPELIKGVKGTSSLQHTPEHLGKGVLRAIFGLNVNKDGTIRYDATELPITHFKPLEIGTSIQKLKEMGYNQDMNNAPLKDENQILELKPHDIILPICPDSLDENADIVFANIAKFIDNLLVRFYGLKPFYDLKSREDLCGHLVGCIAPHNSAAVVGRIIGFSKMQALLASPYIHAAMRRDCDGDEAAVMLLLDMLLNFSREFLPAHRGGTQDAPLVLNSRLRAGEVDDMIFDIETVKEFPLELYEGGEIFKPAWSVKIDQIKDKLSDEFGVFKNINYTHETTNINDGVTCSAYKKIPTMQEKVQKQMELVEKIRAVDTTDVARLIIERHLIRDIRGNLRKFSTQEFRCVKCNEKFRRPPLQGTCSNCGGKIIFTISQGGITKYLEPALSLAQKYNVPPYVKQNLELTKKYIESIFGREMEKQEALQKWFAN